MPSIITHAAVPLALYYAADRGRISPRLLAAGVVVRDQRAAPRLGDALRITLGTPAQNDRVLAALDTREAAA